MRFLHYLELENFKRFSGKQRIELDHPAVLIGPNNCGKTSAIQSIALWSQAVKVWVEESETSTAKKRTGKPINRLNLLQVPVPKTRYFWHDMKVSGNKVRITLGFQHGERIVPIAMDLSHHASDELIYCTPSAETAAEVGALRAAAKLDVALLYPMSGIASDEAVMKPNRIDYHLGRGSTAEVLRNLCLLVYQQSKADWARIADLMQRLFKAKVSEPKENDRGAVDLFYSDGNVRGELDISMSGRGFQQLLLIFSYLFAHKKSVLLVDEPDAHLEILRQRQVYVLLRAIAQENGCQVILVTHSEVVLDEALDRNLTLLLGGDADNLASKTTIKATLKQYGAEHYIRARECGYVVYVEGSTDLDMLRALAVKLGHPLAKVWDDKLNVYYVQNTHPDPTVEMEIEQVEGGFGIAPREHYLGLLKLIPGLLAVGILDNDGKGRQGFKEQGLDVVYWRRYEAENYFITPELLERYAVRQYQGMELFDAFRNQIAATMKTLLVERVFGGSEADYETYRRLDAAAAKLIWETKTERLKLSDMAEEFFRRLSAAVSMPMLLRKGELHELVKDVEATISVEVKEKLDLLAGLLAKQRVEE
jgi:ABC-type cobalamin/Fe3+-siderophores transport system ATPase subunit